MKCFLLLALLMILSGTLISCSPGSFNQSISVMDAWARPAALGQNGAAYFTLKNPTGQADRLLSATTEIAQAAEFHLSEMDANGVMSMRPQEFVDVPAGGQVEFEPGGLHVMLVGLTKDLKGGDSFSLTLQFEEAGDVNVEVQVQAS